MALWGSLFFINGKRPRAFLAALACRYSPQHSSLHTIYRLSPGISCHEQMWRLDCWGFASTSTDAKNVNMFPKKREVFVFNKLHLKRFCLHRNVLQRTTQRGKSKRKKSETRYSRVVIDNTTPSVCFYFSCVFHVHSLPEGLSPSQS